VTAESRRASSYLLTLLGLSAAFYAVYYGLHLFYIDAVLWLAEHFLAWAFRPFALFDVAQGLVITDPQTQHAAGVPQDLFSIGANVVFAPALVIATLGAGRSGVLRAIAAVGLMAIFHALHVASIVLTFLASPQNDVFPLQFTPLGVSVIQGAWSFFDKAGYAFLPFVAWLLLCAGPITRFIGDRATARVKDREEKGQPVDQNAAP
jgi:hypothetical protein